MNDGEGIRIDVLNDDIEPVMLRMDGRSNMNIAVSVRPDRDNRVTGSPRPGGIAVGAVGVMGKERMARFVLMMKIAWTIYENGCKVTKKMVEELTEDGVEFTFYGVTEPE